MSETTLPAADAAQPLHVLRVLVAPFGKLIKAYVRHRDARRNAFELRGMSDHALKDIGISRCEILYRTTKRRA